MKTKKIIKGLKNCSASDCDARRCMDCVFLTKGCETLTTTAYHRLKGLYDRFEKRMPIIYDEPRKYEYRTPYVCPTCGADQSRIDFWSINGKGPKHKSSYCWMCGQHLSWDDVHDNDFD